LNGSKAFVSSVLAQGPLLPIHWLRREWDIPRMSEDTRVALLAEMRERVERLTLLLANIHPGDVGDSAKQEMLAQVKQQVGSLRAGIETLERELHEA